MGIKRGPMEVQDLSLLLLHYIQIPFNPYPLRRPGQAKLGLFARHSVAPSTLIDWRSLSLLYFPSTFPFNIPPLSCSLPHILYHAFHTDHDGSIPSQLFPFRTGQITL